MPKGGEVDLGPAAGGSRGWPRPQESAEQCSGGQREASYGEKVKKIVVHQQSGQAGQAGETAQRAKEAGTMSLIELERQIEKCGAQIEKQRPAEEVTEMWYKERMAPEGVKVFNPAFDVTDHELIAGIVTEYGVARAPYTESLAAIFAEKEKRAREKKEA